MNKYNIVFQLVMTLVSLIMMMLLLLLVTFTMMMLMRMTDDKNTKKNLQRTPFLVNNTRSSHVLQNGVDVNIDMSTIV